MTFSRSYKREPRFGFVRVVLALPFILAAVVFYTLTACALIFVDKITGEPLSRELIR